MMRASTALSLVLACLYAGPPVQAAVVKGSAEQSRPQALPVVDIPHETFVLSNGLTVIVHEDHTTPVVSVGIWYHVGSAHETLGRTGFAHLFEHLMFNGSENANTDWFAAMNEVGATGMNGTTGNDRTNYYQTVPTGALDRVLWLESDRMGHLLPVVDEARLEEQRRVVQNEKRQRANSPLGVVPDMIASATYPSGHPYSWTPIGSMEDLNAAELDDVGTFFNRWYGPSNAVLSLSGDITPAEAREKVERYFGDIASGPPLGRRTEYIAKMSGESRAVLEATVANAMVMKVWNAPGWASEDAQLLELATSALAAGANSRLQRRLVRDLQLASDITASVSKLELGSQVFVQATVRPGVSLQALEEALDAEIAAFLREGPSADELERIKFDIYSGSVRGLVSTMSKAQILAEGQLYAGSSDFYRQRLQMIYAASPESIREAARRWMSDGVYVLEVEPRPTLQASAVRPDRTSPPAIGAPATFALPPLRHATLSNGLKVALAERHDVPTVSLAMVFDVGSLPDRDPASVGHSLGTAMATTGTTTMTDLEIAARQQTLGAGVNWSTNAEFTRYSLSALKINLEASLDLYVDILRNPTFPEAEWDRRRDIYAANYADNLQTGPGKAAMVLPALNYGRNHPYAQQLTPEIAATITTDDFRAFYSRWIRPDLATLYVVGDTTLEEITPLLEDRLSDWRAEGPAPVKGVLPDPERPVGARVILIDQPGAESTVVQAGQAGHARSHPDYETFSVINMIMGGTFTSRLNMNLREDKGWSYGAVSEMESDARFGRVSAGAVVQADRTADALREIDREIRELGTSRPPSEAEIASARNSMLLGMPATLQGSGGVLTMYRTAHENDLPEDYWDGYVQRILALTPEQIAVAARAMYDPSSLTWVVIGDLSRIEADVRALNLGEVEIIDPTRPFAR